VLVLTAPEERGLIKLLRRLDVEIFRAEADLDPALAPLPLEGRKLHMHVDGTVE
jgi:hypothetical protein